MRKRISLNERRVVVRWKRSLGYERLEDRAMLAAIAVQNGTLLIEGHDGNDVVSIIGVGTNTGIYHVTTEQGTQQASGVFNDIVVNLRGGNDQLTMDNAYVNGTIAIRTENGDDIVILGHQAVVSTSVDLQIDLGAGNDRLDGKRLFIGGNQVIDGGDGNDALIFDGFLSPQFTLGTSAAGSASWLGGNGHDFVHVVYGFIVGAWTVDLGDGSDAFDVYGSAGSGNLQIIGGAGFDSLRVDTNFFDANLLIQGDSEDDSLFLANGLGTEIATLAGGDGSDAMTAQNQTAGVLQMVAGAGNDYVEVHSSAFDQFFALFGEGNDSLRVRGSLSRLATDFDGEAGVDRLIELNNTFLGVHRRRGFEIFS